MSHHRRSGILASVAALAILATAPDVAHADFLGNLITVEAVNADGRGTWQVAVPPNPPDMITYTNPDTVELRDAEQMLIGTIDDVTVHLEGDPVVSLSFVATAGSFPTTFTVSSAVVSLPAISNPTGNASASVTLTDSAANGASATPVSPKYGNVFADVQRQHAVFSAESDRKPSPAAAP
jgi:hypothetical protein